MTTAAGTAFNTDRYSQESLQETDEYKLVRSLPYTDFSESWHHERYALTYALIVSLLRSDESRCHRVLDVGGESWLTAFLRERHPDWQVDTTGDRDVRDLKTFVDADNRIHTYDLIICTEVLEHLHDVPTQEREARAMWIGSGQLACLRAMKAALRPNSGRLLVTTPNAASYGVLRSWLLGEAPVAYRPHVREVSPKELRRLALQAGLDVVACSTWTVWDQHRIGEVSRGVMEAIKALDAQHALGDYDRGDDLYLIAAAGGEL